MEVMQWSSYNSNAIDSSLDEVGFYGLDIDTGRGNCDFFSPTEEYYCFRNLEEKIAFDEVQGFFNWTGGENGSPSEHFSDASAKNSLVLPNEDLELDNQTSIPHLLKACGEAIENRSRELVEVILRRLRDKGCPKGAAAERLAYYLTRCSDERSDGYLAQEASKNYEAAFRAMYQIFPYGRFAHFVANSLILEGVPEDAEAIRIVDFDMGEGVQWPPLIEALGKKQHGKAIQIRLVSIKFEHCDVSFEKAKKKRLCECAASSGLKLAVEEIGMEELVSEVKRMEKKGRQWLVFNCMVGLPHMGKQRSSRHVAEFLKAAQESINNPGNSSRKRGIITFGDGIGLGRNSDSCGFGFFFEAQMGRLTALLESMECQMPSHLREARIAMECLFVAPFVSSLACLEERGWRGGILPKMELDGLRMSEYTIAEAKEFVREGESLHWVKTQEEENENQAVLCFVGTPLVRVSGWS